VQVASEVFLYAEESGRASGRGLVLRIAGGLGRLGEVALGFVFLEGQLTPPINRLIREDRASMTMPATIGRMLTVMKRRSSGIAS